MVKAEEKQLPPGFRFKPKDEELISCYLKPKIMGHLSCNFIKNKQLYGPNCTSWDLFDVNDNDSWIDCNEKPTEKVVYVFTTLSKLRSSDSDEVRSRENTSKKAGCGTWAGKTRRLIKDRKGDVIGEKRMLEFEINVIGVQVDFSKVGYFKMHEYSLCGVNTGVGCGGGAADVVLCKITFDSSKKATFKLGSNCVGEGQKKVRKNKNLEASVGNNVASNSLVVMNGNVGEKIEGVLETSVGNYLEGTGNLTSNSLVVMNSNVGDHVEGTECLRSENLDFGDFEDYLLDNYDCGDAAQCSVDAQFNNGFQESNEFGGNTSFNVEFYTRLLTSDQEQKAEDTSTISELGKREFEEQSLYGTKKMCL